MRLVKVIEDRPYNRCLVYGCCKREADETAGFQSGCSINHVKKHSSLVLYIVRGRMLKGSEGKAQCIPMIGYSEKRKRKESREDNGENSY